MTPQELLLALSAPVLALIILLCWLALQLKARGSTSLHLRFLGLELDIRSCSLTESQCRRALSVEQSIRGSGSAARETPRA